MSKENDAPRETQQYDVFFSYSRKDTAAAMLVKSAIQSLGYTVFYDQDVLEGDADWRATIARSIDRCSGVVFLRTGHSVESGYCQREVLYAGDSGKSILPVAFRRDQADLPNSDQLKLLFQPLQTTFISDLPTIAELKNALRPALEKAVGEPQGKENSLLLTDLMATAADNLNSRFKDFFEEIQARRIESDVLNDRLSFIWPFVLGDEQAKLCISLNRFSKRPVCYANCKKKKECPFFVEKDRQEYSLEACLDFADHGKQARIEPLLGTLFFGSGAPPAWCGNWGTKYFFRRRILEELQVSEKNDLTAVLELLREAVRFFDACFDDPMRQYFRFAHGIVSIFREKERTAALIGEGWSLHDERKSRVKLHFTKNSAAPGEGKNEKDELGILCSCALEFPEALRIKLDSFDEKDIGIRIFRFDKDLKTDRVVKFGPDDPGEPREKLKKEIDMILQLPAEKLKPVSHLPEYLHKSLNRFIQDAPGALCWDVSQDRSGCRLTASCWFPGCPEIRFVTGFGYHSDRKTLDWAQTLTSSFPGTAEDEAARLSKITGFPVFRKSIEAPDEAVCRELFADALRCLNGVHGKVYHGIYLPLKELEGVSERWRAWKADCVLLSDSRSKSGNVWNDGGKTGGGARTEAGGNNEKCWEYYLAPGTRFCRRLRKGYPVMFCIRFARSGAGNATVGWVGDGDFNTLSVREKELFWHCVLSQFPPEVQGRFACRKNAVFLAKEEDRALDPREKRPEVFGTVREVRSLLERWLSAAAPDGACLMDRMFAVIERTVDIFKCGES